MEWVWDKMGNIENHSKNHYKATALTFLFGGLFFFHIGFTIQMFL